jgi:hypothetical protein
MYSRISSAALVVLALAGCSGSAPEMAEAAEHIPCALEGAAGFSPTCTVERQIVPGGTILVIRHPDGGFRRFEIEGDLVRTADGVNQAVVTVLPDATQVAVGTDRYRLPPPAPPVRARPVNATQP